MFSGNSSWTEGTVEVFENLTYCTQWKILMARIESHVQLDGRLIPSVKLVDTNSTKVSGNISEIYCVKKMVVMIICFV